MFELMWQPPKLWRAGGMRVGQSAEAFSVGGASYAAIRDDCGNQFVRRYVESKVVDIDPFRGESMLAHVGHFFWVAFFDRNIFACRGVEIDCRKRSRDVER